MYILGVAGSPRRRGNTEILMETALSAAAEGGAQTEMLTLKGRTIQPCDGCYVCQRDGECHIDDDLQEIYVKCQQAAGIILGSPIFFHSVTGPVKNMMDRFYGFYYTGALRNKVAGAILVAGGSGHIQAWNHLQGFFNLNRMFCADPVYGFARDRGDIHRDRYAMLAAGELGRQMVALVNQGLHYPEEWNRPVRLHIKEKYGINSTPSQGRFAAE